MRLTLAIFLTAATSIAQHQGPLEFPVPDSSSSADPSAPYDFKGDRLGMSLALFKTTHRRVLAGDNRDAPMCSDTSPHGLGVEISSEDAANGFVNCRLFYPFEISQPDFQPDTIANMTASTVYRFVDGKLYLVFVSFRQADFEAVRDALIQKLGQPATEEEREVQNLYGARFKSQQLEWRNDTSSVLLAERAGKIDESSVLFLHTDLAKRAEEKRTKPNAPPDI